MLEVSWVGYRSVRTSFAQPKKIPDSAKIGVEYFIDAKGVLLAVVYNLSQEIITIDQTKSFLVNTNGISQSYFDPTITASTTGTMSSETTGLTFNLGAISNAFGVGGALGSLLGGTSLGYSTTNGSFSSNTVIVRDMPTISIAPRGKMIMSKQFEIHGVGIEQREKGKQPELEFPDATMSQSPLKFSVCISYTIENEPNPKKLVTEFYVNSALIESVQAGKVSGGFRKIYNIKPDALVEPSFVFVVKTNIPEEKNSDFGQGGKIHNVYLRGSLVDYQ